MRTVPCLGDNDFAAYLDGCLSEREIVAIEGHFDRCQDCRQQASLLAAAAAAESASAETPLGAEEDPDAGARIGRYVILKTLGSGGMGLVVEAYDPELDRRIAIKVLRPDLRNQLGKEGQLRLRREAQVMAQLSDPNVITVHDVGMEGERLFIAMECIEGASFREWLAQEERGWRATLRLCCQAGDGLAAAHSRGIVHRDFKLDNVLIRSGTRAVVTDFGLAGSSPASQVPASSIAANHSSLTTHSGVLMGTPAYMAPEVFAGQRADAASDQFSFCVATYQALFGTRPFAGASVAELASNVTQGKLVARRDNGRVPSSVRKVLERGLRSDPNERYSSMAELLVALRRSLLPRRVWLVASLAGATVLIAILAALLLRGGQQEKVCGGGKLLWQETWNVARSDASSKRFAAAGLPDVYRGFAARIAGYGTRWQAIHEQACQATHVQGSQSDSLLDLRMECLLDGRRQVQALIRATDDSEPAALAEAAKAAAQLPPLDDCSDLERLQQDFAMPRQRDARERIEELQEEYARVRALHGLGVIKKAVAQAKALSARVATLPYPPLRARVALLLAETQVDTDPQAASEAAQVAALDAASAHDDDILVEALRMRLGLLGRKLNRVEEATGQLWMLDVAVTRAGGRALQVAGASDLRAKLLREAGNIEEARDAFEGTAERMRIGGLTGTDLYADVQRAICATYLELGEIAQARSPCLEATSLLETLLGAEHPLVASAKVSLGTLYAELGDLDRAEQVFGEALHVIETTMGADHPTLSPIFVNLGNLRHQQGRFAEALVFHQRALQTAEAGGRLGDQIAALANLSYVHYSLGDAARAVSHGRRAVQSARAGLGPSHPDVATPLLNLAGSLVLAGDLDEAAQIVAEGRKIVDLSFDASHPLLADFDGLQGDIFLAGGDPRQALVLHEKSYASYLKIYGDDYPELIHLQIALARDHQALGKISECARMADLAMSSLPAYGPHPLASVLYFTAARCLQTDDQQRAAELATQAIATAEATLANTPSNAHVRGLPDRIRHWRRTGE